MSFNFAATGVKIFFPYHKVQKRW